MIDYHRLIRPGKKQLLKLLLSAKIIPLISKCKLKESFVFLSIFLFLEHHFVGSAILFLSFFSMFPLKLLVG